MYLKVEWTDQRYPDDSSEWLILHYQSCSYVAVSSERHFAVRDSGSLLSCSLAGKRLSWMLPETSRDPICSIGYYKRERTWSGIFLLRASVALLICRVALILLLLAHLVLFLHISVA